MNTDARGHAITTDSNEAAASIALAIETFAQRQAEAGAHMRTALTADPDCTLAQAMMGIMMFGARSVGLLGLANKSLVAAKKNYSSVTAREQLYVDALELCLAGKLKAAVRCYETILEKEPTDLLALVFLQSELFWLGDMPWSARVSAKLGAHWSPTTPGYSSFLAVRAFDLEESNQLDEAERITTEALSINPGEVWGAHAFAHIMLMQNRIDEGIQWMGEREALWRDANQMQFHLAWHRCLFLLERGEHAQTLQIYDTTVRNREHELMAAMPDLYIDLQNASSLLWRLENVGVDVGNRWQELSEVCTPRLHDMSNPFTSAHFALVLAANGQFDDCDALIQSMQDFANNDAHDLATRYQNAALPAAKAAIAHRKGEHDEVVELLRPAQHELWTMGGSHAQQDVYFQVLADSTAKKGDQQGYTELMGVIERIGFVEPTRRVAYSSAL